MQIVFRMLAVRVLVKGVLLLLLLLFVLPDRVLMVDLLLDKFGLLGEAVLFSVLVALIVVTTVLATKKRVRVERSVKRPTSTWGT